MKSNRKTMKEQSDKLFKEMILNDPDFQRKSEIRAIDDAVTKDYNNKKNHHSLTNDERLIFSH